MKHCSKIVFLNTCTVTDYGILFVFSEIKKIEVTAGYAYR